MPPVVILHFTGIGTLSGKGQKDMWVTKFSTEHTIAKTVASEFGKEDYKSLKFYGNTAPPMGPLDESCYVSPDDIPKPIQGAAIALHDIVESVKEALAPKERPKEGEPYNYNWDLAFGDGFAVDWIGQEVEIGTSGTARDKKDSKASVGTDDILGQCHSDRQPMQEQPATVRSKPGRRETQPWHREAIEKVYDHMLRYVLKFLEWQTIRFI